MNTTATAMSSLESLFAQPLVNAVGWALVHFVWQGAAVAAIVAVLLAVLRRASANVRYVVACVALLGLACLPIATAWCVYPQPPTRPMMSNDRAEILLVSSAEMNGTAGAPPPHDFIELPTEPDSPVAIAPLANPSPPFDRPLHARAAEWIERGLPWLVAAWLIGVLGLSTRLLAGWAHVQRIRRRHARPAADPWPARLAELARRLRVTRPVRLLESAIVEVPIVIGWLRPVILLPASALVGLTPHQLEALLAHELAHIRRQDYLVNLLQTIVETLLFYHPAVWWVSHRIRAEREECCDDLAVSVCGDPVVYARALASMEEIRGTRLQLGVAADGGALLARIRRLVGVPAPQASRSAWWLVAAIALAVTGALGAGMRLSTSASQPQESKARLDEEVEVQQGLNYIGQVTDHDTGKPIESATVVVRQMLLRVEPESIGKVLAESKHQTNADGKYSFAIQPAHAAKPLYIKIEVQHPKYAAIMGDGYSLDMIRKNQELGDPPFFAAIRLRQAAEIHGQVLTPDGEPAAGVRVLALTKLEINEPARNFEMLRTHGIADDQGRFRLMPSKDGRLLIYLDSNNYSPLIKIVDGRGDLGRFTLQEGITLKGKLLDSAGQPLPARWVVARRKQDASVPVDQDFDEARQVFYFQVNQSALTNERGEYALAPLPAAAYTVTPAELSEHWFDYEMRPRPLSAVFYGRDVMLKAGAAPDPLDFRAVPHVSVEVQCVNSKDEPQAGQDISIQGGRAELNQTVPWNSTGITDSAGNVRLLVPRGLDGVGLYTIDNEHHAVTFQQTKDSPPVPGNLKLGIVNEDITGIILRRHSSPIVLIKVSDEAGAPVGNVEIRVSNRSYTCWIEKHGDGRYRTAGLMPDAEATITVKAPGYQTRTEKITLPESSTKDLEFVLEKEVQSNVITPKVGVDDPEVRELLGKLKDPNQRERRDAVRALGLLGPRATPAIPALIEKLKDDDPYIRTWAAFGLGRIGAAAKEAVPSLEAAVDDRFGPTRREAAEALFRVDHQASKSLAVLCELLRNPPAWPDPGDDDVPVSSQLMYSRADTTWAIGHIVRYAREAQPPVDASADAKPAVPILIDQLKVSHLRGPSLYSLGMIGKAADAAIPVLLQLLKDSADSSEPISVALARIGHDPAFVVPALLEDLQSEEVRIRYQVIESLGDLGPHAKAAVPELRKALEDDDESVRAAAKKALQKIGAADGASPESAKPAAAQLRGRLFVGAGLRTAENETRFVQLAIAIDPNSGGWTRVQSLQADGFTVPISPVRVSPDGRTTLFMREKEIWKCDARTGERPERVLEKGSPAAWSPDGKTFIAVVETNERDAQFVENWIVSADGQKQSVLVLPKGDAVEDWSADGQWLAVRSRLDSQIYLVKPDGSGRRRLADSIEYAMGRTGFSPDGRRIVYLSRQVGDDKSRFSLRTINVDGTGDREILGETKAGSDPDSALRTAPMAARWSPDGKYLTVVLFDYSGGGFAAIGGNWRLAIMDADGGNLRELKLEGVLNTVLPWDGPEWRPVDIAKVALDARGSADEWGAERDGLRTRLVLLTENPTVGQPLKFRLEMKNFGKVERQFDPQVAAPFRVVKVKKEDGEAEPYIGLMYQTSGGPEPIKPGETTVLWDDFDVAESFLLVEPRKYVVQSSILPSNAVTIELAPGRLPELKAMFVQMREIVPKEKAWRISMSGRAIFFTHSPTNLKKDVTTIQLWFDEKEHPPGYSLGEGANKIPVERLGKTPLGFAYMTAPAMAAELWPEFRERIRSQLGTKVGGSPESQQHAKAVPKLRLKLTAGEESLEYEMLANLEPDELQKLREGLQQVVVQMGGDVEATIEAHTTAPYESVRRLVEVVTAAGVKKLKFAAKEDDRPVVYTSARGSEKPVKPGEEPGRQDRWQLLFPGQLSEADHARILDFTRMKLAVETDGVWMLITKVSDAKPLVERRDEFDERWLHFTPHEDRPRPVDAKLVRKAGVSVSDEQVIRLVITFETEQLLARLERDYLNKAKNHTDMRVVRRTRFVLAKKGRGFEFQIESQEYFGEPASQRNDGEKEFEAAGQAARNADANQQKPGITLLVLDPDGQPTKGVYLNVWRKIERSEAEARNKSVYEVCWQDSTTGEFWGRHRHWSPGSGSLEQILESLEPGEYRVSAASFVGGKSSDATPFGLSELVRVAATGPPPVVTVRLAGDTPLVVKLVDSKTREPVRGAGLRLVRSDGVPVTHGGGSAWLYAATDDRGEVWNRRLVPGTYWIEVIGKAASQFEPIEYPPLKDRTRVEVTGGNDNSVEVAIERVELSDAEQDKRWPWIVFGRVTDAAGKPVDGATVRAHCGYGTLRNTGSTTTNADGRYKLRFTGGIAFASENSDKPHTQLQAALISATKPGFTERNLGRQGGLSMATRIPAPDEGWEVDPERTVLPSKPIEVNFVLTAAVTLEVELNDATAKPIAGRSVSINGKELPPGSSVIEYGKTDDAGRIRFEWVPPHHAWWITAGLSDSWRDGEVRTLPITFASPGQYRVRLRLRADDETKVNLLEIQSVTGAASRELRDAVVGDDPLRRPPVSAQLQERGRTILTTMREANRYWLDRPPPEVRSYQYDFKFGDDKSTTFAVPEDAKVSRFIRNGISYDSALHYLTAEPGNAVFRLVEEGPETIKLAYTLSRPIRMSAGNGVEGTWNGYFSTNVHEGVVVIDTKTLAPREHSNGQLRETFGDYVEIRPGHYAPLSIAIRGGHHYEWTFRVYEPGLWLLASARRPDETGPNAVIATVGNVLINGQPVKGKGEAFKNQLRQVRATRKAVGTIVSVDNLENRVYVDRGSDDHLALGTTFSVWTPNRPGKQPGELNAAVFEDVRKPDRDENLEPRKRSRRAGGRKACIEIVAILGPHQSLARITEDELLDPITPGDLVFSPIWAPGRPRHFALAGRFDVPGRGVNQRELLVQIISQQGGLVDAILKDDGAVEGEIKSDTDWLVLGSLPGAAASDGPQSELTTKMLAGVEQLKKAAHEFGVEVIDQQKLFDLMGLKRQKGLDK